jgi:hypothetical protein
LIKTFIESTTADTDRTEQQHEEATTQQLETSRIKT